MTLVAFGPANRYPAHRLASPWVTACGLDTWPLEWRVLTRYGPWRACKTCGTSPDPTEDK